MVVVPTDNEVRLHYDRSTLGPVLLRPDAGRHRAAGLLPDPGGRRRPLPAAGDARPAGRRPPTTIRRRPRPPDRGRPAARPKARGRRRRATAPSQRPPGPTTPLAYPRHDRTRRDRQGLRRPRHRSRPARTTESPTPRGRLRPLRRRRRGARRARHAPVRARARRRLHRRRAGARASTSSTSAWRRPTSCTSPPAPRPPGAIFTASHNPAEYNGVKLCLAGARPVGVDGLGEIKASPAPVLDGHGPPPAPGRRRGRQDLLPAFVDHVVSFVDPTTLRPLRVVADTANGMGGLVVPAVFERLPMIELEVMYGELDGTFPNHPADPLQPANQRDLRARVVPAASTSAWPSTATPTGCSSSTRPGPACPGRRRRRSSPPPCCAASRAARSCTT